MSKIEKRVVDLLSAHLGLEPEDIDLMDSFRDDLHMNPSDLAEFSVKAVEEGLLTKPMNFKKIKTVSDLIEHIRTEEEL